MPTRRASVARMPPGPQSGQNKGGRPTGATTRLTRTMADEILQKGGLLPLLVMSDNMEFYHLQGSELVNKILAYVATIRDDQLTPAMVAEIAKLINATNRVRVLAQQCAVDMAPYIHARLASVTVKTESEGPLLIEYSNLESLL